MTMLSQVTKGKVKKPIFVLLYGPDGVGKSTFGAQAPSPIFLGTEDGTSNLDVTRFPAPKTFADCMTAIDCLTNEKHDYKTLVIDSLDWLEPILWKQLCEEHQVKSIETVLGGYGKGYTLANSLWHDMIKKLKTLRETKGMNIIVLAHSEIKTFQDPQTTAGYDRYQLKLNAKASAIWREGVEAVLFANFEVFTKVTDGKAKAYGEGARMIFTERRPAYDAKNRYGLPLRMALSWDELSSAVNTGSGETAEQLKASIKGLLENVKDEELKKIIVETTEKAGDNAANLSVVKNRLLKRLGE